VAIGVLTLLLVIALTFFRASLGDMKTSQNTVDGVRAELMADGATAVAIAFLNHDRLVHPTYSSLDFATRTYFNGAWAVGKPWMWAPIQDPVLSNGVHRLSLLRGGVPEIDRMKLAGNLGLATAGAPNDSIYIPRADFTVNFFGALDPSIPPANYRTLDPNDPTLLQSPFVTTADLADPSNIAKFPPFQTIYSNPDLIGVIYPEDFTSLTNTVYDEVAPNGRALSLVVTADETDETLPSEQIDFWTDVDNDGDGLKDSMWLPFPADRFFPEDGLDNDLDGRRDALGADGIEDSGDEDTDGEPGVFMYRGDTDSLDNDGDGIVDETDEYSYVIFTVPYPFMADTDGDNVLDIVSPTANEWISMGVDTASDILMFEGRRDNNTGLYAEPPIGYGRSGNSIYARDNDYDLVTDQPMDASPYMLTADAVQALVDVVVNGEIVGHPYFELLRTLVGDANLFAYNQADPTRSSLNIAGIIRGETVTEIAGRMAILITDESSKVNINAAGGLSYAAIPNDPELPLTRAFSEGVGPHEYDLRVLPGIGAILSNKTWTYKLGGAEGRALSSVTYGNVITFTNSLDLTSAFVTGSGNFAYDVSLPGYGWVDDNANLLQLALGRVNYDGLPLDSLNPLYNPSIDGGLAGERWKGIDEPFEYQRFRPYRNVRAEGDGNDGFDGNFDLIVDDAPDADNDDDEVFDELGEFGDTYYRTHQQLKLVAGIGQNNFDDIRNLVTAHSTDRNERHRHLDSDLANFVLTVGRQTTGLRKDLNITRPQDVARAVTRDWTYPASVPQQRNVIDPATGAVGSLALSGVLGTQAVDLTDTNFGQAGTLNFLAGLRQENTTVTTSQPIMGLGDTEPEGTAFTLLADAELRAHQVAATIKDFADRDYTRSVDDEIFVEDRWWQALAAPFIGDPDPILDAAARIAQSYRIYYTTAGLEAIRINEVNLRPVRRVEAEAMTDLDAGEANAADFRGLDPNRFVPHGGVYPPADQTAAEAIEEEGFRIRVSTTTDAIAAYNTRESDNIEVVIVGTDGDPVGERWDLRPLVARDGTIAADAGLLGLEAAWATYRQYLDVRDPDAADPTRTFQVPDVVQFSFQATQDLPAGNYYVKLDVSVVDDSGTVLSSANDTGDFLFAVKTGTFEQDWFTDVMNIDSYARGSRVYNEAWRAPALLGSDSLGGSAGMAFLQGDAVFAVDPTLPAGNLFTTTLPDFALNNILQRNLGFTIRVPDRTLPIPPVSPDTVDDDQWLHVAIRSMRPDAVGFVVNAIEFSQEPDHEWIEVTNESDEAVDLSNWQLAVENHPLGIGSMTVPPGTTIAPRGMLLLGTNKFDFAFNEDPNTGVPLIVENANDDPADPDIYDRGVGFFSNGIGLAADDLTGPSPGGVFLGITVPQILFNAVDVQQGTSFFRVGAGIEDYLDTDGNGLEDHTEGLTNLFDDDLASTLDPLSIFPLPQSFTKPWDRIVELIIPDLVEQVSQTSFAAADVGRIVLGGGIFPNRPEFDAWDNDGDNRIIGFDNIDNDGDGVIDEASEGSDEGRFARDMRLAEGATPVTPVPGSYNAETTRYLTNFFDFDPIIAGSVPASWDGGALGPNPPQWKEFLERRNFPGDNVIVTLYEGLAKNNQVADRVTYTQRDVENRQIDDILLVNDFDQNTVNPVTYADAAVADPGVPLPLDDRFLSFWPENTMGIDFARSLERKLPSYTGDRFGVQNRFQATDGNYDDWSDSAGRWERTANANFVPGSFVDRLDAGFPNYAEFAHAIGGTPLRRNVAARYALANGDRGEVFALAEFPNHPLVSPGSASLMPHTSRTSKFLSGLDTTTSELFLIDPASPNVSTGVRSDETYDAALLGQRFDGAASPIDFFHDLRSFIGDVGTTDSVSLNVGQANVIQVDRPAGATPATATGLTGWGTGQPPQAWAPLLTFEIDVSTGTNDGDIGSVPPYGYDREYLFQPLSSLPPTVDNTRWPMALRSALYASSNFNNVDLSRTSIDGAQAIFVWDGEDGLENGEYDLYVVTTEDLSLLAEANVAGGLLTDPSLTGSDQGIGLPFVSATDRTANREVFFDIEAFRDSNGDRKAWAPNLLSGDFLQDSQLNRGQVAGIPAESFGEITGAQPDADGVIHYGVVRVENNFLAVSLRNRSAAGTVARFSRVMLSARNKTPGRININTAETKRVANGNVPGSFYNPLVGLPGVVARPSLDSDNIDPSNIVTDSATGNLFDDEPALGDNKAQVLARHIADQRLRLIGEQPDGRYYELTSDLLADAHFASVLHPTTSDPSLRPALATEYDNYLDDSDQDGVVDDTVGRAGALAEAAYRFRRMQNLVTTRGDTYEILVTVQAGYGTDANGDGRINWRDDSEFTATAEKTARTIYER